MRINNGFWIFGLTVLSGSTFAASFDCAKAVTHTEKLVCTDGELSLLDEQLSKAYTARRETTANKDQLKSEQLRWLKARDKDCADLAMCKSAYQNRILYLNADQPEAVLTPQAIYERFNLRSIFSSFGPRLKYFCESYPNDFFPRPTHQSAVRLVLESDGDVLEFTIKDHNQLSISQQITSGSYNSEAEYKVYYDTKTKDWRASETFIAIDKDCVTYSPNE